MLIFLLQEKERPSVAAEAVLTSTEYRRNLSAAVAEFEEWKLRDESYMTSTVKYSTVDQARLVDCVDFQI